MMHSKFVLFLFCICFPFCMKGQDCVNKGKDIEIINQYLDVMSSEKSLPTGELMVETARFFLGKPYVGGTLEKDPEQLVVNLRELDCMTLVETVTALVHTLRDAKPSYDGFCRHLQEARYRNGQIKTYTDRLHYTTDWIYENEKQGRVKDVTHDIGGKPLGLELSFMSTHPESYKQLKNSPELVAKMAKKEKEINARSHYFIPETAINTHAAEIRDGDIVCFVTTVKGLDISHVGIICREGDKLTFIHASASQKKVIVNEEPLQDYVQNIKRNSGIMIVRPLF